MTFVTILHQIECYQRDVDGSNGWCAVCKNGAHKGQPGYCPTEELPVKDIKLFLYQKILSTV